MAVSTSEDSDVLSEINITPLVDVMLVLLVAFVITIPALTNAIHVNLPRTVNTTPPEQQKAITITVGQRRQRCISTISPWRPMRSAQSSPASRRRSPIQPCICARTTACPTAPWQKSWRKSSTPESPRSRYSQTTNDAPVHASVAARGRRFSRRVPNFSFSSNNYW